jgi:BirA family biotin operon repressor/biotin-[acetyl-CoA-carboxylase] ligase
LATPYAVVHLAEVASTQDEARLRVHDSGGAVLVVADRQVGGRGRSGRTWWEAPRAMYSSLAFAPAWPPATWPRFTLVAGLAVRAALADFTPTSPGLKWPNDLVAAHGKIGGILTEAESGLVVIGAGVNLWWPGAPDGVSAACPDDPGPELATSVAVRWADSVLAVASNHPGSWGVEDYRSACTTIGRDIRWDPHGAGRAVAVDDAGGLVVDTAGGRMVLSSGEVRTVRRATVAPDDDTHGGGDQR